MKQQVSVAIIGGGAMGTSLLYHLAKLGWQDVVLIEKNELTAGSTWHAAGLCTHYAHNITVMNMRAHSVQMYKALLEQETGEPVSFHPCGALRVTRYADRMNEFKHVQDIGRFAGFDFHILDPKALKEIYPLVRTDGLLGAIYEPLDGHVDPSQAVHAMARGARNQGAEIYRHTQVTAIEQSTDGLWVITTDKGQVKAEHVVNAAGTWCREIGGMMGLDLPVVPMLHQYLVTDRVEAFAQLDRELPMIRDPDESWYLRMERDGVIIGPYEKHGKPWSVDGVPKGFGMELLPPDLDAVEDIVMCAMERVPPAAEAGIKRIVNGPITFTPDANPLIGPAFGLDRAWLLTGSSMGVMEGGGAGRFLAEWMTGGEPPMDALAVDSRRFGGYADRDYRVTKAVECFAAQFGIHYPHEERPAGRRKITTPVYERLKAMGAVFGSVYGSERPNWFSRDEAVTDSTLSFTRANWFETVGSECRVVQASAGLADMSVFSKFEIRGPDAERFMGQLGANRPPKTGRVRLNHVLTPSGGVASEFTVTCLKPETYYVNSAAAAQRHDEDILRRRSTGFDVRVENVTYRYGVLALAGPESGNLLQTLTDADLSYRNFPPLSARRLQVAGIPVIAMRLCYVHDDGFELHHELNQQRALFDRLTDAGRRFDLGLYGAFATNAMRLEMGYRAWGADLTTERTPLEAGLDPFVKTHGREFTGKDAMLRRAADTHHWCMRRLHIQDTGIDPFYLHTVYEGDEPVGIVTSGAYGHRIGSPLALAYFKRLPQSPGELTASITGRRVTARLA